MRQISLANAIINQMPDLIEQAIAMGADVNELDEFGFTPLIEAAIVNDVAITKTLLDAGADAAGEDMVGGTALHWAAQNNNIQLAKLLIDNGADVNAFTQAGEMPYVKALLRNYKEMAALLLQSGADETFARDFINLKLLGHRFALRGYVDILTPKDTVAEVNLEGFVPEFSLGVILKSLREYTINYAAKKNQDYFDDFNEICTMLADALELLTMQDYLGKPDIKQQAKIRSILDQPRVILPVSSEGHLLTLVKFDNFLVICDRRRDEKIINGIRIFKIRKPSAFTVQLCNFLVYEKKELNYIYETLPSVLRLEQVSRMMIEPQMSGNCSWANMEATIPVLLKLLHGGDLPEIIDVDAKVIQLFHDWRDWDQKRALQFFVSSFKTAKPGRQAMIAALSAAIVFQRCDAKNADDLKLAMQLGAIFMRPEFKYLIDSYIATYKSRESTQAGANFQQILDLLQFS